jgi:hypothetical protein
MHKTALKTVNKKPRTRTPSKEIILKVDIKPDIRKFGISTLATLAKFDGASVTCNSNHQWYADLGLVEEVVVKIDAEREQKYRAAVSQWKNRVKRLIDVGQYEKAKSMIYNQPEKPKERKILKVTKRGRDLLAGKQVSYFETFKDSTKPTRRR